MSDLRTAAQQALEALEIGYDSASAEAAQYHAAMAGYRPHRHAQMDADVQKIAQAITALRAALEQPEQEPVAWLYPEGLEALQKGKCWTAYGTKQGDDCCIPVYTYPLRREPEQEPVALFTKYGPPTMRDRDFWSTGYAAATARAVEAALKERNA